MAHPEPRRTPALAVLVLLAATARGVEPWIANHPLRRIKAERLVYRVTARKFIVVGGGTVEFTLTREDVDGERQLVIAAHAQGAPAGIPFDSTITTRLRDRDYTQLLENHHRTKPRYKTRRLRWHGRGVDYLKHKHCEAPTLCHNPRHLIKQPNGQLVHCPKCDDPAHFVWSMRERHRFRGFQVRGLIAALYLARGFDITPGGPPGILRVISGRNMWDIHFGAEKEETITVPVGKLPCYKIDLKLKPANKYSKKHADEFDGPFGLTGKIHLYIDKLTRQAVLIKGKVDIDITTFDIQVYLTERSADPIE